MNHDLRRQRLTERVGHPVLLSGNGEQVRNLPMNKLPFRQDSTFLYFTGCTMPGAAALISDDGYELFVRMPPADDALWHGPVPTAEALRERYGADRVTDIRDLEAKVREVRPRTLAVSDEAVNRRVTA